ncbi:hypothetical protein [Belnapia moabensis]|uniref:hypothetical protein n=1 Tax=Belnapia moabensis TaxID=365533 RepID=UPI0012EDF3FA|nr:hypothetical protein [Belnapia moabensis]
MQPEANLALEAARIAGNADRLTLEADGVEAATRHLDPSWTQHTPSGYVEPGKGGLGHVAEVLHVHRCAGPSGKEISQRLQRGLHIWLFQSPQSKHQ